MSYCSAGPPCAYCGVQYIYRLGARTRLLEKGPSGVVKQVVKVAEHNDHHDLANDRA
jgi:hypothetical protein